MTGYLKYVILCCSKISEPIRNYLNVLVKSTVIFGIFLLGNSLRNLMIISETEVFLVVHSNPGKWHIFFVYVQKNHQNVDMIWN